MPLYKSHVIKHLYLQTYIQPAIRRSPPLQACMHVPSEEGEGHACTVEASCSKPTNS
jgi:hypothetical protein